MLLLLCIMSDTDSELGNFSCHTGKDDNCSGFSNAKFAIMSACRLSCLVTRERVSCYSRKPKRHTQSPA